MEKCDGVEPWYVMVELLNRHNESWRCLCCDVNKKPLNSLIATIKIESALGVMSIRKELKVKFTICLLPSKTCHFKVGLSFLVE